MSANVDLPTPQILGIIAFGRVASYARIARDVSMTVNVRHQLDLARMGTRFIQSIDALEAAATQLGTNIEDVTQPFQGSLDDMEARTRPGDWWERVVKSYVMVGMLCDLEDCLGQDMRGEVSDRLSLAQDAGHGLWVKERIGDVLGDDDTLNARLSMWGRRVAGEVLGAIQRIVTTHSEILPEGTSVAALLQRLTAGHARRLDVLGLAS
ncbi:MAG: ferritin-like fold-containing protein [Actinomycetaceae bacterium]|nr:ferritin-like fold-containing protein [Actinomycetaceae bacterium]